MCSCTGATAVCTLNAAALQKCGSATEQHCFAQNSSDVQQSDVQKRTRQSEVTSEKQRNAVQSSKRFAKDGVERRTTLLKLCGASLTFQNLENLRIYAIKSDANVH